MFRGILIDAPMYIMPKSGINQALKGALFSVMSSRSGTTKKHFGNEIGELIGVFW
jgi:hypothetical protein